MSDVKTSGAQRTVLELLLAAGLGLAFLGVVVWQVLGVFSELSGDWTGLTASVGIRLSGTPLGKAAIGFVLALLLVHTLFGIACWGLAFLSARAFDAWRERRLRLLFGWFALAVVWVLVGNASSYPWSNTGIHGDVFIHPVIAGFRIFDLLTLALVVVIAVIIIRCVKAQPRLRAMVPRAALYGSLLAAVLLAMHVANTTHQAAAGKSARPNIILIGIDSLREDAIGEGRGIGLTPNLDYFLSEGGHRFTDAITPLARTFASWTAILTGRYPVSTGARENLLALSTLKQFTTLADVARDQGYHTIYSTDEVRFSNIDASFGFDQVITPTIGAADFLLGKANDFPLSNLVSNTWIAKWLFPATYGNRASMHTYRPETYVHWLNDEIVAGDKPTLLVVHLTLPHNPYLWAERADRVFNRATDRPYQYANAVIAADAQFAAVLEMLERKGMLHNALVAVLSDHGEALGVPVTDTLLRGVVAREMNDGQRISHWGHGTSVLSPHQFATLLAVKGYGPMELPQPGRSHDEPVSLVDVAPTLIDLAGLKPEAAFDGRSLKPLIEGAPDAAAPFHKRARFTETGFRTPLLLEGDFDESRVMGQAAAFFRMNPDNGRFEVRAELLTRLIADKERAALSSEWLLAAIPASGGQTQRYIFVSRRGLPPRRFESAPSPADGEAYLLWQALHQHYGAEMLPPAPKVAFTAQQAGDTR